MGVGLGTGKGYPMAVIDFTMYLPPNFDFFKKYGCTCVHPCPILGLGFDFSFFFSGDCSDSPGLREFLIGDSSRGWIS